MKGKLLITCLALIVLASSVLVSCRKKEAAMEEPEEPIVELSYWSNWNETETQAIVQKEAIKEFMELNPNVKITVQWSGREIRKTLQTALDAGTKIDIWSGGLKYLGAWSPYALSLDEYFKQVYPSTNGKTLETTIMRVCLDYLRTIATDGKLYAVPYQPFVVAVFYNKDHFDKAGIVGVPSNWSEFLDASKKLKAAGFTPITIDDAYMDVPLGMHLNRKLGSSEAVEALVMDESGKLWDDPRVLEAAQELEALALGGYISPQVADNKWPAGQQEVATGQVSIYFLNGTWLPNEVMATAGEEFNWGQFAYPGVPGGEDRSAGIYGFQGFQINKDTAHPDEAFALAAHLSSGKWDKRMSEKTYGAPMDTSTSWPSQIAESQIIFNNLKTNVPFNGGLSVNSDLFPVIKAEFNKLLSGKVTAKEFIANIKAGI